MTGLYLSRLTVPCTVHALSVANLVRAIVLTSVSCHTGVWFSFTHRPPQFTFLLSGPTRTKFLLSLLSLDHSGAASGIILLIVWQFAAFVDVVLACPITRFAAHALWVIPPPRVSPGFRGQRHILLVSLPKWPVLPGGLEMSTAMHVPRARSSSIRRACSRRVRVASVCCGVHCASTNIFSLL